MPGFTYIEKTGEAEIHVGGVKFMRGIPSKNVPTALIPELDADPRFVRNDGAPPAPKPGVAGSYTYTGPNDSIVVSGVLFRKNVAQSVSAEVAAVLDKDTTHFRRA